MSSMCGTRPRNLDRRGEAAPPLPGRRAVLRASGTALLGGAALALAGCGYRPPGASAGAVDLDQMAVRYTHLALQLAKHQPSLVEEWTGPADRASGPRLPVATLQSDLATLVADAEHAAADPRWAAMRARAEADGQAGGRVVALAEVADALRVAYLSGQIRALDDVASRLLGVARSFADQARRTFGHAAPPRDVPAFDALRAELAAILPAGDSLAARHAAYRRSAAVPPERVDAVFRAAVDWCRAAARPHLPLPDGDTVTTRAEDTSGWAAFSRPTGPRSSDIWVAKGGGADAAHLLQLAAHEGTPGHHAQHVLARAVLADGLGWTERRLHPAFGPHLMCAEGAAEAGAALLLPNQTRIQVLAEVLLPAAGQPPALAAPLVRVERLAAALDLEVAYIAADYLDTSLSADAATTRLRDEALVLDAAGMVGFIEKQRTNVLAYPLGRRLVTAALGAGGAEARWARLAAISTTLTLAAGLEE
jgi:hypothetical protein